LDLSIHTILIFITIYIRKEVKEKKKSEDSCVDRRMVDGRLFPYLPCKCPGK
jgi:hypothetical protein